MRDSLDRWISDADALRHLEHFRAREIPLALGPLRARADDYYTSLVGELFARMRDGYGDASDWARLGNALVQFAERDGENLKRLGINASEARLFAATAFYIGGYPASAHLTMRPALPIAGNDTYQSCFDFLARPKVLVSETVLSLMDAVRRGDSGSVEQIRAAVNDQARSSLFSGPNEWIPARLLQVMIDRFGRTNLRAVLPAGDSEFWTPLVSAFLAQQPPSWEFFPSQIQAISQGLLTRAETFSLQMPTGAGKTALCETLLYYHLRSQQESLAILLVPYRSLASELRGTLVKRLNQMGLLARTAYGGTVPIGNESAALDEVRALVATPESLSGLLSANPEFFRRVTLVVCDEGHLLDSGARGVSLELLLARMKTRLPFSPRFVFISAIVPNIEEINSWLGGAADSVVRSEYRPAIAEFSTLRSDGNGRTTSVALEMHPHSPEPTRYRIESFLSRGDFQYINPTSGRSRTYTFTSIKAQAIAAARKTLPMGAAAVFAANKRGSQGAIGLAEELLSQLAVPLVLPLPMSFADGDAISLAGNYVSQEYGVGWIGARILAVGAVLHHGDIPQETREVIERLLRMGAAKFAICTSTLAEGVNLPIRTLVLYSVTRRLRDGSSVNLLARDIKNLVGRAGRAGATTKGLVICANSNQWTLLEPVANQALGEPVAGALRSLVARLRQALAVNSSPLTNEILDRIPELHTLIDGIDSTLIEMAAQELGEDVLIEMATMIADQTFASTQADDVSKQVLRQVFQLRTRQIIDLRASGRLRWIRETGARTRMVTKVENGLLTAQIAWEEIIEGNATALIAVLVEWGLSLPEMQETLREAYELDDDTNVDVLRGPFQALIEAWISGKRFVVMASELGMPVDDLLHVHTMALSYAFQTIVEQGMALLGKVMESQGRVLSPAAIRFPELLRFGVPTEAACILGSEGVRHRSAQVALGTQREVISEIFTDRLSVCAAARQVLFDDEVQWKNRLGELIFQNTLNDLNTILSAS